MATDRTADDTVGTDEDVHVEVDIHLQCRKDYDIKGVDCGSLVLCAGIFY